LTQYPTDIEHAFQALAMDERREAFRPTLWYIPWDVINDKEKKTPDLKQVWVGRPIRMHLR